MGKVFGVIALIMGITALALEPIFMYFFYFDFGNYVFYVLAGLAIVFGILGIVKDHPKGLGVVGLIVGIIALTLWFIFNFLNLFSGWVSIL